MTLTEQINKALSQIQSEDHVIHKGLRDTLFDSVQSAYPDDGAGFFPIRPSSALKPMRDIFYDLKNFYTPGSIPKEDFEPRVKLIFQFGHVTELILKKLCAQKFEVQYEQERVKYGELVDRDNSIISLTGSIDWAMRIDNNSSALILCDAKSIGDFPFKTAPKEANIAQMQLYMHSDWGRKNNVNNAMLIYFNKNSCDIKCIELEYDAALAVNLLHRLKAVWEYYLRDEVPPREYLAGLDWQADYSSYKEYDNTEFTLAPSDRNIVRLQEYAPKARYEKDLLRTHIEKYGNKIVEYLDKQVYVRYIDKKLKFS